MLNNSLTLKEWSELHRPYMSYCLIHWKDQRQRSLNIICSVHDWTLNVTLFQVSELQLCHLQKKGNVFQPQWGVVMVSVNHGQDVQAARTGCRGDQVRWLSFKGGLRVETVQVTYGSRFLDLWASLVMLVVKEPACNAGDIRDMGSIPGSWRSPGERNGNPLQYSCLESPMDRSASWATDHGVIKSQTRLKRLSTHTFGFMMWTEELYFI